MEGNLMKKENWTTIVFSLENYVQELQESGAVVTPHIWKTLELAVIELDKN